MEIEDPAAGKTKQWKKRHRFKQPQREGKLVVWSANTQGRPGAWRILRLIRDMKIGTTPDVVMLQDMQLEKTMLKAMEGKW